MKISSDDCEFNCGFVQFTNKNGISDDHLLKPFPKVDFRNKPFLVKKSNVSLFLWTLMKCNFNIFKPLKHGWFRIHLNFKITSHIVLTCTYKH